MKKIKVKLSERDYKNILEQLARNWRNDHNDIGEFYDDENFVIALIEDIKEIENIFKALGIDKKEIKNF